VLYTLGNFESDNRRFTAVLFHTDSATPQS
jgi:hypothetical protein